MSIDSRDLQSMIDGLEKFLTCHSDYKKKKEDEMSEIKQYRWMISGEKLPTFRTIRRAQGEGFYSVSSNTDYEVKFLDNLAVMICEVLNGVKVDERILGFKFNDYHDADSLKRIRESNLVDHSLKTDYPILFCEDGPNKYFIEFHPDLEPVVSHPMDVNISSINHYLKSLEMLELLYASCRIDDDISYRYLFSNILNIVPNRDDVFVILSDTGCTNKAIINGKSYQVDTDEASFSVSFDDADRSLGDDMILAFVGRQLARRIAVLLDYGVSLEQLEQLEKLSIVETCRNDKCDQVFEVLFSKIHFTVSKTLK